MAGFSTETVIAAVRVVLPPGTTTAVLHEPWLHGREWDYIKECLDTGWVSSAGKYVDTFEAKLAEQTGAAHVSAVMNGTAALHVCLQLVGVQPGDEVLVPALTFIATANAVSYCGATPHFVDSALDTLGVDPARLADYLREIAYVRNGVAVNRKTGRPVRALIPMHTFGHPVDMDAINEVAAQYSLAVVEDAAESLGSLYKGRVTGTLGRIAALSFNGNKVVTTGGGGAIITNDPDLGRRARHLTTTARVPHRWSFIHDEVGYNYRLPNINAALGCAQLESLPESLRLKRALAERYRKAFADVSGVRFFVEPGFARSNYWLNAVLLDAETANNRDKLLDALNAVGIRARPAWTLMHRLPMYRDCPRMPLDTAEDIERRLVNLPSSAQLGMESVR
jgi:perosamine synthetase